MSNKRDEQFAKLVKRLKKIESDAGYWLCCSRLTEPCESVTWVNYILRWEKIHDRMYKENGTAEFEDLWKAHCEKVGWCYDYDFGDATC